MPTKLTHLEVNEISLVDKEHNPANQGAKVILLKVGGLKTDNNSKNEGGDFMKGEVLKIFALERSLVEGRKEIKKAMRNITKDEASDMVSEVAKVCRGENPKLSSEQSWVKAMDLVPRLAGLAQGKTLEMVMW